MEYKSKRKSDLHRLEDFISLSKQGETISLDVHLRIESILRQHEQCEGSKEQIDGHLFIGDFQFYIKSKMYTVSKVYSLTYLTNDPDDLHVDRQIANARLKMDYNRLQKAGINVQEMYFAEEYCF